MEQKERPLEVGQPLYVKDTLEYCRVVEDLVERVKVHMDKDPLGVTVVLNPDDLEIGFCD